MISAQQIVSTYPVIRPHVRRTPIIAVDAADFGIDAEHLVLKLECLQHTGSFKVRGASGGNHGVAVAYAARKCKVPAKIFVPTVAASTKIKQISEYGANLVVSGERYADALDASQAWAGQSGALPIHAFDQEETLRGQGTVGLELEEQAPDITTLLVAVGGGGLIAGISAWYHGRIKIVGVEPELAPTLTRALESGRPVDAEAGGIAADSLAPRRVGELVFPIVRQHVAATLLVSDDAIRDAQRRLWSTLRIVAEPGGATALAALVSRRYIPATNERVAVLVCGANSTAVDFDR